MSTIVLRQVKGTPLTVAEVDTNFSNLNTDKLEKSGGAITTNASTTALTITQTGTGNALLVEDSANPDSTPFLIDNAGQVLSGFTTTVSPTAQGRIEASTVGSTSPIYVARQGSNSAKGAELMLLHARAGSGTNTSVAINDATGEVTFWGADGTDFVESASVKAFVDGTPGTNDMPGRLVFSTTADGASSPTEKVRIDKDGLVSITSTKALKLPVGTTLEQPTGVAGYLRFNTTLSKFEGYDGTVWGTLLQTGTTVSVAQGGTGSTSLTTNAVLLGNGTSNVQTVAPGTSGNLLTSNGTSWASSAPSASILNTAVTPGTSGNVLTSNGTSWVSSTPTGGSGLFNTSISASVGYAVTTSSAAAFTAPATASRRYIVHSIHVTNIGTVAANITTELTGTTYSSGISLSNTLPVPVGGAVELLKKPKVMQPSDVINMLSDQASTLHATIIYETSTDVKYFGSGVDVTTDATYTDLYTMTADSVLESVLVVNDSLDSDAKVTLVWTNGSNVIQGYYAYDFIIALNSTVELLEKPKFVTSGYKLRIQSNVGNRVEAIVAGKTV
jgi:hypothetical protein